MSAPGQPPDRNLSRREFDLVIRRAAELTAQDSDSGGDLRETDLYRIAREVGLPEDHVRRALSEVRSGTASTGLLDRVYGPSRVVASRVLDGTPEELARELDTFMVGGRLLQRVRRTPTYLLYRPAVDWISSLARAASATSRRYYVASSKSVEVHLTDTGEGGTLVEIEVDPGIRGDWVAGGMAGGVAGGLGGGVGTGVGLALISPEIMAITGGVLVGGAFFAVINKLTARAHRRKWMEVLAEVEGVLDHLETGEPLEPPPPSWRRWVERQFHGARRLLQTDEDWDAGP